MRVLSALAALLVTSVSAVFQDEAYSLDFHHALLGEPIQSSTFVHQPFPNSQASLLYTFSQESVIGAINPKDGSLLWRQSLPHAQESSTKLLRAVDGQDIVISATDSEVSAWIASTGRLIWTYNVTASKVKDVQSAAVGNSLPQVVVLTEAAVFALDGSSGVVQGRSDLANGDISIGLAATAEHVYYVSLHKAVLGGYKTRVTEVNVNDGTQISQRVLASDGDIAEPDNVRFVGTVAGVPLVIWTDSSNKVLKTNILGTDAVSKEDASQTGEVEKITIVAPSSVKGSPQFLVQFETAKENWAQAFAIENGQVRKSVRGKSTFDRQFGKRVFAYSSHGAELYLTSITKGDISVFSSSDSAPVYQHSVSDFLISGIKDYVDPSLVVSEVLPRAGTKPLVRAAIFFSSGDWIMNLNGERTWHRPESLANAESAVFVTPVLEESLAEELAIESHSNIVSAYLHRLQRHAGDVMSLPALMQQLPERILASLTGRDSKASSSDTFGFRKYALLTTRNGRKVTLDLANGGTVTENVVDTTSAAGTQTHAAVPGSCGELDGTENPAEQSSGCTLVHFSTAGEHIVGYLPGQKETPLWRFSAGPGTTIHSIKTRPRLDPVASIGKALGDRRVLYKYLNPNLALVAAVDNSKSILSIYLLDSVSGKLLYEAEHAGVDTSKNIASVVSENWISYSFTAIADSKTATSQGSHLVSAELYESAIPDDRGVLGAASNYSAIQATIQSQDPYVVSQSYQIPEEISHLSVSLTSQGITTRLLMAVLPESQSIIGIPRAVVDPRRVIGRDPTSDEQMEGLSKYMPNLEFDPRWYLSHKREVLDIKKIIAAPAVLESTSLVFAYGFDVFGTRVTPSFSFDRLGKDFNKVQMLATVAALAVGVLFVVPLVAKKEINLRWQIPS